MDSAVVSLLITYGPLGLMVLGFATRWLFPRWYVTKLEDELKHLREQVTLDRRRGDEAEEVGMVTNKLITALTDIATEKHHQHHGKDSDGGLTWEDLK